LEIRPKTPDSHIPTAPTTTSPLQLPKTLHIRCFAIFRRGDQRGLSLAPGQDNAARALGEAGQKHPIGKQAAVQKVRGQGIRVGTFSMGGNGGGRSGHSSSQGVNNVGGAESDQRKGSN
jgi:hypothetical protein